MLALAFMSGSLDQIQAGVRLPNRVSQYCAPPQEDAEAPRFYCRQHGQHDPFESQASAPQAHLLAGSLRQPTSFEPLRLGLRFRAVTAGDRRNSR
jgi:hypothetical protein